MFKKRANTPEKSGDPKTRLPKSGKKKTPDTKGRTSPTKSVSIGARPSSSKSGRGTPNPKSRASSAKSGRDSTDTTGTTTSSKSGTDSTDTTGTTTPSKSGKDTPTTMDPNSPSQQSNRDTSELRGSSSVFNSFSGISGRTSSSAGSCTEEELVDLTMLFEDRTFVDYFNVFNCLPAFGQHIFFVFPEKEFVFEPPVRQRRNAYLDQREVLRWLYTERFALFKLSALYTEYLMCRELVETDTPPELSAYTGEERILIKNVLGSVVGMLLFRESLRGSCGEHVYRCWKDIQAWKQLGDPVRKIYWKHAIKNKYIIAGGEASIRSKLKLVVFSGELKFDLVPEKEIQEKVLAAMLTGDCVQRLTSNEALPQLQVVLLAAMKLYWVPRFVLRIRSQASPYNIEVLSRPYYKDVEAMWRQRSLKSRMMFPTERPSSVLTSIEESRGEATPPSLNSLSSLSDNVIVEPKDLLALWGGPSREMKPRESVSSVGTSLPEDDSDPYMPKPQMSRPDITPTQVVRSPCPLTLTSYLGGRERAAIGKLPSPGNRALWALASDTLASCPFRIYLIKAQNLADLFYLSFWTDVRNYLDTDDAALDSLGCPLRKKMAHMLAAKYLASTGEASRMFSESLRMSLFQALSQNNDTHLLVLAQDAMLKSLWLSLRKFVEAERQNFLKHVTGRRYNMSPEKRKLVEQQERERVSSTGRADPMYFYHTVEKPGDTADRSTPIFSKDITGRVMTASRASSVYICISEEQFLKSMELVVLCAEYGSSMMCPDHLPEADFLVSVLHSDFGSLTVTRVPTVRQEWLRNLINPPKIDIERLKVSRIIFSDKVDIAKYTKEREERDDKFPMATKRLGARRSGICMDRPPRPKCFVEVLTSHAHFDFFKRFMIMHKAPLPAMFWRAIEDLKELSNAKTRQIRTTQIVKKFFGKFSKYGALLDCHEEIIRQIPKMERVTAGILICAQAAVYRSLERKWYPLYLDTFPPELNPVDSVAAVNTIPNEDGDLMLLDHSSPVYNKRRMKRKKLMKTMAVFKKIARSLVAFHRSMLSPAEAKLFEVYLKCEMEKENNPSTAANQNQGVEKNIVQSSLAANIQNRIVIKNRLIILSRLPADMRLWIEMRKYQELIDSSCVTKEFLKDKATSIVECFVNSDIPPRVQVNIPNDLAISITNTLTVLGPVRYLFHDVVVLLFPILCHYWKKFNDEWLTNEIPAEYIDFIAMYYRDRVGSSPNCTFEPPTYLNLKIEDFRSVTQVAYDDCVHITFSVLEGVTVIIPQTKKQAEAAILQGAGGRRNTVKQSSVSLAAGNNSKSPHKDKEGQPLVETKSKNTILAEKKKAEKEEAEAAKKKPQSRQIANPKAKKDHANRTEKISHLVETVAMERTAGLYKKDANKFNFNDIVQLAMTELHM